MIDKKEIRPERSAFGPSGMSAVADQFLILATDGRWALVESVMHDQYLVIPKTLLANWAEDIRPTTDVENAKRETGGG